jgi:hypothetical protein
MITFMILEFEIFKLLQNAIFYTYVAIHAIIDLIKFIYKYIINFPSIVYYILHKYCFVVVFFFCLLLLRFIIYQFDVTPLCAITFT